MALQEALILGPGQFYVDSSDGGDPPILGVTHRYSARRFHVRPDLMPLEIQEALAEMPMTAEADHYVCDLQPTGK